VKRRKVTAQGEHLDVEAVTIGEWYAIETAKAACAGDTEAAQRILKDFVDAIDGRRYRYPHLSVPIYSIHARFLADAFKKILDGKDAALALGIKSSKPGRRPKAGATYNRAALAAAFNLLLLNGLSRKQAKLDLRQMTGATVRTIEKANRECGSYRRFLEYARKYKSFAKLIKDGAAPYAKAVAAILAAHERRKSQ
jgi:hypothetical protein